MLTWTSDGAFYKACEQLLHAEAQQLCSDLANHLPFEVEMMSHVESLLPCPVWEVDGLLGQPQKRFLVGFKGYLETKMHLP